jgi:ParB/RepB/Spo0J family partition protein
MDHKTLFEIDVSSICPNPHNPRLIFDAAELDDLKSSIAKVGILVPITVYKNSKNFPKSEFVLLDGERRWRCARELNLKTIPANVIDEPEDVTQNILFMFNIHHYRREWELFPTALKLEQLMNSLGSDQESVISSFTGVSKTMIRRCKALLWFPKKYRNVLMERDGKVSTDFFIELYPVVRRLSQEDEYPYPDGVEHLTDGFIKRFTEDEAITDVKDFREVRRSMAYCDKRGNFSEFKKQVSVFLEKPKADLSVFAVVDQDKSINAMLKHISYLSNIIENTPPDSFSDIYVLEQLKRLSIQIKHVLDEVD